MPLFLALADGKLFRRYFASWFILLPVANAIFYFYPTLYDRVPLDYGTGLVRIMFTLVNNADPGTCLLPSMHVCIAWLGIITLRQGKGALVKRSGDR